MKCSLSRLVGVSGRWMCLALIVVAQAVMAGGLATPAAKAEASSHHDWWKQEKLRAFVARSSLHFKRQPVTAQQVQRIKDAGFNVFVQRWGVEDMAEVRRQAGLCEQAGLYYAVWMRASLPNQDDPANQLAWRRGQAQQAHSPLSDALWSHLESRLSDFARLSLSKPCIGVMLDFENYYPNKQANLYAVSYDPASLGRYASSRGLDAPPADLLPADAWRWYDSQPQAKWKGYEKWFADELGRRAKALRRKLDAINPRFQIMGYMNEGLTGEVIAPAFGTAAAPFVMLGVNYGRPSPLLEEAPALLVVQDTVRKWQAQWRGRGDAPALITGGAMPGYAGAPDPEFSAKKLATLARDADGYWVWFELNFDGKDFDDWLDWYGRANRDIVQRSYAILDQPRQTPEPERLPTVKHTDRRQVAVLGDMRHALRDHLQRDARYEVHPLEGRSADYLRRFDLVILQGAAVPEVAQSAVHETLRQYVAQGGSLLLAFNTLGQLGNPFPQIAQPMGDTLRDDASRQVADPSHALLKELAVGRYTAHYRYHIPLKAGLDGQVLVRNKAGQPTLVVGAHGQGRVAFMGDYLARRQPPVGDEAALLAHVLQHLTDKPAGR